MLQANAAFVAQQPAPDLPAEARRAVIVSCMDSRLVSLLPAALHIRDGDAKVIKTAGALISHPFGGIARSIIVALYALNAGEVFIVAHHDCGMNGLDADALVERMHAEGGVSRETVRTLEAAGINIRGWLRGFSSLHDSVTSSVAMVRRHPLVPPRVPVHGLILDPKSGALEVVVDGNEALRRTALDSAAVHFGVQ